MIIVIKDDDLLQSIHTQIIANTKILCKGYIHEVVNIIQILPGWRSNFAITVTYFVLIIFFKKCFCIMLNDFQCGFSSINSGMHYISFVWYFTVSYLTPFLNLLLFSAQFSTIIMAPLFDENIIENKMLWRIKLRVEEAPKSLWEVWIHVLSKIQMILNKYGKFIKLAP